VLRDGAWVAVENGIPGRDDRIRVLSEELARRPAERARA
jgi:hypothetical protein